MLLLENIMLALNSLIVNKMRSLLTMLGIIIGIAAVIAIVTVGNSLTLSVSENMQSMGASDIYALVAPRTETEEESMILEGVKFGASEPVNLTDATEADYITQEMVDELVKKFSEEIYAINVYTGDTNMGTANYNSKNANIQMIGASVGYFVTMKVDIIEGRMLSQDDFENGKNVIVIADKTVKKLFDGDNKKALGSEIELSVGSSVQNFTVVGVYEYKAMSPMMAAVITDDTSMPVYMPLRTAQNYLNMERVYSYLQIITKVDVNPDELSDKIESFFEAYYKSNRNFTVTTVTMTSMLDALTNLLDTLTTAISVVAAIALLVGGIGVMNIMLVSVTERTREIGTRKALGAKNSSIRIQFIVEAVIICLIGGAIGVIIGIGAGIGLSEFLGYPAHPSIGAILIALAFSMTIGIFFGYYPANKAAKLNPIDALRYE